MKVSKLAPVLFAERIEPCLELWEKRLGFKTTVSVPEGDHLGFVILERDGVEVMYQTWQSAAEDIAELGEQARSSRQFLFLEIADLAAFERALAGIAPVVPKRTTFYGMTEVIIHDPAGHVIVFAEPTARAS